MSRESRKLDQILEHQVVDQYGRIEVMPNVKVSSKHLAWFIDKMINPESNMWIWIRRIANILTFPILVLMVISFFQGA